MKNILLKLDIHELESLERILDDRRQIEPNNTTWEPLYEKVKKKIAIYKKPPVIVPEVGAIVLLNNDTEATVREVYTVTERFAIYGDTRLYQYKDIVAIN